MHGVPPASTPSCPPVPGTAAALTPAPAASDAWQATALETPPRRRQPPSTPRPNPPDGRRPVARQLYLPPPLAALRDDLWLGTAAQARALPLLRAAGITHIVNATIEHADAFPAHFTYLRVPVVDRPGTDLTPYFDAAVAFDAAARDSGG